MFKKILLPIVKLILPIIIEELSKQKPKKRRTTNGKTGNIE